MKKFYAMMAIAALCLPASAETFDQDAVALTGCIQNAEASSRPKDKNWLVAMYVEGGYKYNKVDMVNGVKTHVQHGDFYSYDAATKADTEQGTSNSKLKEIFSGKTCNGIKFDNIAMNSGIGEVTVPSKIYVDGTLTEDAAKSGDLVFRYGFGTNTRIGLKTIGIDLNLMNGFEAGMELPDNNPVEVTFSTSVYDINDGLGTIGHVAYYELGNAASASSSNPKKVKVTNLGELQGDKEFLAFVEPGKEWYHVPIKWIDIIVHNVKPGDTVGIFSLKSTEGSGASVAGIEIDDENAPVEYFNMQGVRVANPENGLYIKRQGSKVTKVMVK